MNGKKLQPLHFIGVFPNNVKLTNLFLIYKELGNDKRGTLSRKTWILQWFLTSSEVVKLNDYLLTQKSEC